MIVNEGSGKEPKGPLSQDPANVAWPEYPPLQPYKPARQGAICHHRKFPGEHPQGSSFLACRGPSSQRLPQGRWRTSPHGVTLRIWPALKGISPCVAGRSLLLLVPSLACTGSGRGSPGPLRSRIIVGAWETGQNKAIDPKKSGCLKEQYLYQLNHARIPRSPPFPSHRHHWFLWGPTDPSVL